MLMQDMWAQFLEVRDVATKSRLIKLSNIKRIKRHFIEIFVKFTS